MIDPELVTLLVARRREHDRLGALSQRERTVLALMARGHSNPTIAADLHLAARTVEAHVTSIFTKLDLAPGERAHRRVLAVLRVPARPTAVPIGRDEDEERGPAVSAGPRVRRLLRTQ